MEKLLLKYLHGRCSDKEKGRVIQWLDADPENMKEYMALRKLADIMIWYSEVEDANEKKSGSRKFIFKKPFNFIELLKIAAIFIFTLWVIRYFRPDNDERVEEIAMQTLHIPAGQRAEIILEDGTKVWLNANSTMSFPTRFVGESREVELDGEGFFDVTPDKQNPFIVKTGSYNVKVWGTRFNLLAYSEAGNFETALLEGAVEVLQQGNSNGYMLKPAERIYLKDGKMVVGAIRHMDYFLWTEGIISFNDASFMEVMNQLEFYFDMKIEVRNQRSLSYRCSGKFRTKDGAEHILKVLQVENKFKYRIDEKRNKITIE